MSALSGYERVPFPTARLAFVGRDRCYDTRRMARGSSSLAVAHQNQYIPGHLVLSDLVVDNKAIL